MESCIPIFQFHNWNFFKRYLIQLDHPIIFSWHWDSHHLYSGFGSDHHSMSISFDKWVTSFIKKVKEWLNHVSCLSAFVRISLWTCPCVCIWTRTCVCVHVLLPCPRSRVCQWLWMCLCTCLSRWSGWQSFWLLANVKVSSHQATTYFLRKKSCVQVVKLDQSCVSHYFTKLAPFSES